MSPRNGSAHMGKRKLGLQEFQEPESTGRDGYGASTWCISTRGAYQCDFNAQENGVGVGEASWVMKDPLARLG